MAIIFEELEASQRIQEEAESDAKEHCIDDQEDEADDGVLVTRIGDMIHYQFRAKIVHEEEESEGECTEPELPSTSDMFPQPLPSPEALPEPNRLHGHSGKSLIYFIHV